MHEQLSLLTSAAIAGEGMTAGWAEQGNGSVSCY